MGQVVTLVQLAPIHLLHLAPQAPKNICQHILLRVILFSHLVCQHKRPLQDEL